MDSYRSILGAQLGANFTAKTPETGLGGAFGIFLVLMGVVMWKRGIDKEVIVKKFCRLVKFKTRTQRILTALLLTNYGIWRSNFMYERNIYK